MGDNAQARGTSSQLSLSILCVATALPAAACSQPDAIRLEEEAPTVVWVGAPRRLPPATVVDAMGQPLSSAQVEVTVHPPVQGRIAGGLVHADLHGQGELRWHVPGTNVRYVSPLRFVVPDSVDIECPGGRCVVQVGDKIDLIAKVRRGDEILDGAPVVWKSIAPGVLKAMPAGRFTGLAAGPAQVTVTVGSLVDAQPVQVTSNRVDSIRLKCVEDGSGRVGDNGACVVKAGSDRLLSLTMMSDGHPALGFEPEWSIENQDVVYVVDRRLTGRRIGKSKVTVEAGGSRAVIDVEVWPSNCSDKVEALLTYLLPRHLQFGRWAGRTKIRLQCKIDEPEACLEFYSAKGMTNPRELLEVCCCR